MVSDIAGINFDPERPGYRHIVFRPHFFDGLDWAEAEYRSVSGPIRSRWERKGDRVVADGDQFAGRLDRDGRGRPARRSRSEPGRTIFKFSAPDAASLRTLVI